MPLFLIDRCWQIEVNGCRVGMHIAPCIHCPTLALRKKEFKIFFQRFRCDSFVGILLHIFWGIFVLSFNSMPLMFYPVIATIASEAFLFCSNLCRANPGSFWLVYKYIHIILQDMDMILHGHGNIINLKKL